MGSFQPSPEAHTIGLGVAFLSHPGEGPCGPAGTRGVWTSLLGLPSRQHGPARLRMLFRQLAKWEKLIEKLELITD